MAWVSSTPSVPGHHDVQHHEVNAPASLAKHFQGLGRPVRFEHPEALFGQNTSRDPPSHALVVDHQYGNDLIGRTQVPTLRYATAPSRWLMKNVA